MKYPIAYLHGMGGSTGDWDGLKTFLPGKAITYKGATLAECVGSLADELWQFPHLCGYSMGGRLALMAAEELLRRGRPPKSVALLATGLGFSNAEEIAERRRIDERWALLAERKPDEFWAEWYEQPLFSSFHALPEVKKSAWLSRRNPMEISNLVHSLRAFGPGNHGFLLPSLKSLLQQGISVLYIVGDLDKKYLHLGQKLHAEEGLPLEIIPGSGHLLPLEAPQKVAGALASFFKNAEK
jgi:pimeloyl-ACP methyl ester carboxylesterase